VAPYTRGGNVLLKTFLIGVLLGIVMAAGALYTIPVVDQFREVSIVSVAPNGGNSESFHINIPADRVMVGATGKESGVPMGMMWPKDEIFENISTEIFKVRNVRDAVIGVASRTVAKDGNTGYTDWIIHLPARGSLFINMESQPKNGGPRIGRLRAGSQEFDDLAGFVAESWVSDTSGEEDAPLGRIELLATYVSTSEPREVHDTELPE
jgi:hypothetical protein